MSSCELFVTFPKIKQSFNNNQNSSFLLSTRKIVFLCVCPPINSVYISYNSKKHIKIIGSFVFVFFPLHYFKDIICYLLVCSFSEKGTLYLLSHVHVSSAFASLFLFPVTIFFLLFADGSILKLKPIQTNLGDPLSVK